MNTEKPFHLVRNRIEELSHERLKELAHSLLDVVCEAQELTEYVLPDDAKWPPFMSILEMVDHLADVISDELDVPRR